MGRVSVWERRFVTVLFTDLCDSSQLAEQLEVEVFARRIETFRDVVRSVVPRHGGLVARLQGDGLLALFGHPQAHEDDGRRAVESVLDIMDALMRRDSSLRVHSGIHAGLVLTHQGDIERGRVDVVGEVPNTAARLCSLAGPDELLVSEETLGPHARYFSIASARRTALRGRTAPLQVLRIAGRDAPRRRIDASAQRGVVPFVGRAEAQQWLQRMVAMDGQAVRVAHLVGEAGVGKTRLLDEFARSLDPRAYRVFRGGCESYLGAELLQPFVQCLRGCATDDDADLRLLLTQGAPALSPRLRVETVLRVVRREAAGRCPVLLLDDWQWADDACHQTLQRVITELQPLRVIVAERAGEAEPLLSGAHRLDLAGLDAQACQAMVTAWLPQSDPFTVQAITRSSGGSPLFIEELCHEAASGPPGGRGVELEAAERGTAWLSTLVASRLARMPPATMTALQAASVVGMTVADELLDALAGPGSAAALREAGFGHGMLHAGPAPRQLVFRHALTRAAVHGTIDLDRRRALHLRVAQWLEATAAPDHAAPAPVEALAYHYQQAGQDEQAAHFAEAAGDRALAAMALDRARRHYLVALDALKQRPELSRAMALKWCSLAERLGQTCVFDPLDASLGFTYFERAVELARREGDLNALARAEYWVAYVNYGRGRARQAVRASEAALEHAKRCGDPRLVAQVQATLGQSLASAGRSEQALALLREAVHLKREHSRPGSGTAIGSAYSLGRMGYTLGDLGRFDEAAASFDEALQLLGGAVHSVGASVRELMCAVHLWQGRWAEAQAIGLAGADLAFRCRSKYLTAMGRALAHCGAWALHRDEASLRALHDATVWIERHGGAVSTSLNYAWLVEANHACGDRAAMRRHAARLMQRARLQDSHGLAQGCRTLALDAWQNGRPDRAERYMHLADNAGRARGSVRELAVNQLAWSALAAAQGETGRARALALAARDALDALGMAWHAQQADLLLAAP